MSDPWSPPTFSLSDVDAPFANAHNRSVMSVDRLAFPHVSLGRVQLDLAAELCVRVVKKKKKPQHPGFPRGPPPWY